MKLKNVKVGMKNLIKNKVSVFTISGHECEKINCTQDFDVSNIAQSAKMMNVAH